MPVIEYICDQCRKEFERLVFSGEEETVVCVGCGSREVKKKMTATSFMGPSIGRFAAAAPKDPS